MCFVSDIEKFRQKTDSMIDSKFDFKDHIYGLAFRFFDDRDSVEKR